MPEQPDISPELFIRQLHQQIDSLRGAGVDWLPKADPSLQLPRQERIEVPIEMSPDATESRRVELDLLAQQVSECVLLQGVGFDKDTKRFSASALSIPTFASSAKAAG